MSDSVPEASTSPVTATAGTHSLHPLVRRFWSVPTLGWIDHNGWDLEKVGWNKARPPYGTDGLSDATFTIYPWEFVTVIPTRKRKSIEHYPPNDKLSV